MERHPDLISGAALLLVSILYLVGAATLPPGAGEPGPAFLPIVLGVSLGVLSLWIIVRGLRRVGALIPSTDEREGARTKRAVLLIGWSVLFLLAFPWLGAIVTTCAYTLGVGLLFGIRQPLRLVATASISTALVYVIFEIALGTRLPSLS